MRKWGEKNKKITAVWESYKREWIEDRGKGLTPHLFKEPVRCSVASGWISFSMTMVAVSHTGLAYGPADFAWTVCLLNPKIAFLLLFNNHWALSPPFLDDGVWNESPFMATRGDQKENGDSVAQRAFGESFVVDGRQCLSCCVT